MNIRTDRLLLRPVTLEDATAMFCYRSDSVENKYQSWIPHSVDDVRDFIEKQISHEIDIAGTWFQFVITVIDKPDVIGDIGIHFTGSGNSQVEVGCTVDKNFQKNGYATEALSAIIGYLFSTLQKHRIIASLDPRNRASKRLVERLGFRKEAHFKESIFMHGEWVDDLVYAMLEKEWFACYRNTK